MQDVYFLPRELSVIHFHLNSHETACLPHLSSCSLSEITYLNLNLVNFFFILVTGGFDSNLFLLPREAVESPLGKQGGFIRLAGGSRSIILF